ncbi:MAG: hypothetical protein QUV02_00145 [Maricaulis sp.]|uniref:hypothetical protein n=1 Tax=Maricaulis sp. TaxID=1486257 RepID=UPI00260D45B8|nr:hypothetical protein [Maricaulis sp.]MDM7982832.1 hypothetical protein [Maricaulis sp.]
MKRIYWLKNDDAAYSPRAIQKSRNLSLSSDSPYGVVAEFGLYGSEEWWENIQRGKIPTRITEGRVIGLFEEGQDRSGVPNSVEIETLDGCRVKRSIRFSNEPESERLKVGYKIKLVEIIQKLKTPSLSIDGDGTVSKLIEAFVDNSCK